SLQFGTMKKLNRRKFLRSSGGALAATISLRRVALADPPPSRRRASSPAEMLIPPLAADEGKKPLRLGLIIDIGKDPDAALAKVHELGLPTSQIFVDDFGTDLVDRLRRALQKYEIEATSVVVGGPGKEVWDFYQGPLTIGLVPKETRAARIEHIKKASDFDVLDACRARAHQEGLGFCETVWNSGCADSLRIHTGKPQRSRLQGNERSD